MGRRLSRRCGRPGQAMLACVLVLACVAGPLLAPHAEAADCDPTATWKTIGDYEYGLVNQLKTQPDAQAYCKGLGGDLASIHSAEVDKELHQMVLKLVASPQAKTNKTGSGAAWLGLVLTPPSVRTEMPPGTWSDGSLYDYKPTWSANGNDPNLFIESPTATRACVHFGYLFFDKVYLEDGSWGDAPCNTTYWPLCRRSTPGACSEASTSTSTGKAPASAPGAAKTKPKSKLSLGLIIGAVVGPLAGIVVLVVLVVVLLRVRRNTKGARRDEESFAMPSGPKSKDVESGGGADGHSGEDWKPPSASGNNVAAAGMAATELQPQTKVVGHPVPTAQLVRNGAPAPNQGASSARSSTMFGSENDVGVAGQAAPRMVLLPGAPPMQGGAGSAGVSSTRIGPGGSDLMMVGMALPAVTTCLVLAREIIDAGDRVVGNTVRCKRLTSRIGRLMPMLERLQAAVSSKDVNDSEVVPFATELEDVMRRTREMVQQWGTKLDGSLGLLKAMLAGRAYEQEFVDLNERLNSLMSDLGTLLVVRGQGVGKAAVYTGKPEQVHEAVEKEVEADTVKDLQQLAVRVANDPKMLEALSPKEQAALEATYRDHQLDLKAMTDMLRLQARQQFIESRMGDFLIRWQDIKLADKIGAGGFGEVHLATWDGRRVAVKVLQVGERTAKLEKDLKRESYIMSQLHHHNVARFYGIVLQQEACALVMAYYPRGTLTARLQDGKPLEWPTRIGYALDVAKGMAYLHSRPYEPIVHGDLKPSNLLLEKDDSGGDCVVITDFGLSRVQTATATTRTGTHSSALSAVYAAPELVNDPNKVKTLASDVYAFGMLMYEIAAREPPFKQGTFVVLNHIARGGRPEVPAGVPEGFAELMVACWAQEPAARPAFDEIVRLLSALQQPE